MNLGKAKKEIVEDVGTSEVDHLHHFKVKFDSDGQKYTVDCNQPRTVLEIIKSHLSQQFKEKMKRSEENIIIKLGEGNDSHIVPTHFPCSCVEEEECLIVTTSAKVVEQKKAERRVLPRENYSVFFIDKEGGKYTKTKTDMIFRCNNIVEQFRYFCVYGRKGTKVVETLRLDGRFVAGLTDFNLSDNKTGVLTNCTEIVDNLDGRKFHICLPKEGKTKAKDPKQQAIQEQDATQQTSDEEQQEKASASINSQSKSKTTTVLEYAGKEGVSLKTAMEKSDCQIDHKEVYDLLRQQFPKLKELMEERFAGRSFNKALKLKKENFGKIQQTFSKVYTMRQLFNLSESICLLEIKETSSDFKVQGTGFVLSGNLVLTNAHLFKDFKKGMGKNWLKYLNISATFNYENPDGKSKRTFNTEVLVWNHDVDYAVLELICGSQTSDQTEIPPGLLKRFGPVPEPGDDGGACIIGHPAGGERKWDVTCIIRKEDREEAVTQNLEAYKDHLFTVCSINYQIKTNPYADIHVTYNSFMYHGSSGSPVFDPFGRVFGFHTGGFFFDCPRPGHSVIEFAFPLLYIFKMLLDDLQKSGRQDMLDKVLVEAQGNGYLEEIIDRVGLKQSKDQAHCVENQERNGEIGEQSDSEEEMDTSSH
ncbi:serine protease FAM111A-like isoform X2 [Girardinichthys multiradiatus]|nr:serine protease FAM111A-like isoform X2 [Girardinichthys multiradiatus]